MATITMAAVIINNIELIKQKLVKVTIKYELEKVRYEYTTTTCNSCRVPKFFPHAKSILDIPSIFFH
jgi:hypothetical protein